MSDQIAIVKAKEAERHSRRARAFAILAIVFALAACASQTSAIVAGMLQADRHNTTTLEVGDD